jgi:hypothetical protein
VRWGFGIGHQIYTPRNTLTPNPDPRDRPYAAFLYGALVLQRQEADALSTFELQAGAVGPSALGEFIQNNTHDLIRDYSANGWDRQLKHEPAVNLVFERVQRISLGGLPWRGLRFSYTQAWRSEEFYGRRGGQAYGSVGVTARF